MKFKVGDKVKVVDCEIHGSRCRNLGKIFTIRKINKYNIEYPYVLKGTDERFGDNELIKLQEKQFTKADLKNGDIVTYRNRNKRTVISGKLIDENGMGAKYLRSYNDRMEDEDGYRNSDIVKVERPIKYETVFERKEEILDETEKRYLANIIKPFRKEVRYIIKYGDTFKEYIAIVLQNEHISLPFFHKSTMYKGMKEDKKYSLKELGL